MSEPIPSGYSETCTSSGTTLESDAHSPYLKLLTGPEAGRVFKLEMAKTRVGRAPDNDIVLDEPGVSREHARLIRGFEGTVLLEDLKSTNGTFVGGRRVTQCLLYGGEQIALGETVRIRFGLDLGELDLDQVLYRKATLDLLTGTLNRGAFLERFRQELAHARARQAELSVALTDLDFFKKVNDTYGHPAGDAVLVEFARRARTVLRGRDALGRIGGEEFAILLPDCPIARAGDVLERVRESVCSEPFQVPVGTRTEEIPVTMSAGIATLGEATWQDTDGLLASADEALYEAKHGGRNRVVLKAPPAPPQDPREVLLRQKRQLTRLACQFPVEILADGRRIPAEILDVSQGGLRLHVTEPMSLEGDLEVTLADAPDTAPVTARVQWSRAAEIGVACLSTPQWLEKIQRRAGLDDSTTLERRRDVRTAAGLPVQVKTRDSVLHGRLSNLGMRGALVEVELPTEPGSDVRLTVGPLAPHVALVVEGRVLRCVAGPEGCTWGVALEPPEDADEGLLARYVLDLLQAD
ncbi:MAG: diguanylate cyclase [Candidatus Eremiobacterota bacterium]